MIDETMGDDPWREQEKPKENVPEEFDYQVVSPDAWSATPDADADLVLARGKEQLEAIDRELASGSGGLARWGALLMLVGLLLMLVLPRVGCKLRERYDRQLETPTTVWPR